MIYASLNDIEKLFNESGIIHSKKTNQSFPSFNFSEEIILITGAAGSIGSQLARHLINCSYKKLILVDIAESALYDLIVDFEQENTSNIQFLLLNVTEADSVEYLFETYKPTLIFHAAAYKHVPLMEQHPYEAVKTNILATKLLADMAVKHQVKKFVFISTDKAVNPVSIMGMSKLIAERYINTIAKSSATQFIITRFGNILGSNGSIVPLFLKQIASGQPLTITHKEMTRYFISNHKACLLILELASYTKLEGNLFTFNMGKPIKIYDLAKKLLETLGKPDYKIMFTNIRPGEKINEELIANNEALFPTNNKDMLLIKQPQSPNTLKLDTLLNITPYQSPSEIKNILKSLCS